MSDAYIFFVGFVAILSAVLFGVPVFVVMLIIQVRRESAKFAIAELMMISGLVLMVAFGWIVLARFPKIEMPSPGDLIGFASALLVLAGTIVAIGATGMAKGWILRRSVDRL